MIDSCKNHNCVEYQRDKCLRSNRHKMAIQDRLPYVSYIPPRSNTATCELYIEDKEKEIK